MVDMLKIMAAVIVLLIIIGIALLGKKILRALIFKSATTKSSEGFWMEIITGLIAIIIAFAQYKTTEPQADAFMWTGTAIFFLGGILQLIARRQLYEDKTFEERLSAGFEAAQTGLYSRLRYPSKSALMLIILGFCLAMGSIWGVAITIILFYPSVLYKISQEDKELLDQFGDRWLDYKAQTKRIIPKIL